MADKPMIQLKDVSKIYDNGTVGLKDINLTINKGEFVVVVGLSGALCFAPSIVYTISVRAIF